MFTDTMKGVPGTNFVWSPVPKKKARITGKKKRNPTSSSASHPRSSVPSSITSSPRTVLQPMKHRPSSRGSARKNAAAAGLSQSASAPVLQHEQPPPQPRDRGLDLFEMEEPRDRGLDLDFNGGLDLHQQQRQEQSSSSTSGVGGDQKQQQQAPEDVNAKTAESTSLVAAQPVKTFDAPPTEFRVTSFLTPGEDALGFEPPPPTLFPELVDMHKQELLRFERQLFLQNKDVMARLPELTYEQWLSEARQLYRHAVTHLMQLSEDFPHHRRMMGVLFDLYEKLCTALEKLVHTKEEIFRFDRETELGGFTKLNSDLHDQLDALKQERAELQHELNVERINNRQLLEDLEIHRKFVFVQTGQTNILDPTSTQLSSERLKEAQEESGLSHSEHLATVKPAVALEELLHADHASMLAEQDKEEASDNFHKQSYEEIRVEMEFVRDTTTDILAELDHRALTRNALTQGFNSTNASETALLNNVAEELEAEMINSTTNLNNMFGNMIQFYKAEKGQLKASACQTDDSDLNPNHLYKIQKVLVKPAQDAEAAVDTDGNAVPAPQQFIEKKVMRKRRPTILLKTGRGISFEREVDPRLAKLRAMQEEKERLAALGAKSKVKMAAAVMEDEEGDDSDAEEEDAGEELDTLYLHFDHFPAYMKRVVCLQQETREELVERFRPVNINFNMTAFGVISFIAQTFMRKIKEQHGAQSRALTIRRYQQPQPVAEFLYDYLLYKFNTPLKAQKAAIEVTRAAVDLIKKNNLTTKPQIYWFLLFCGYEGHVKLDYPTRYVAAQSSVVYLDTVACISQHFSYRKALAPSVQHASSSSSSSSSSASSQQSTAYVIDETGILDVLLQLRIHFPFGLLRNIVMDTFGHISAKQHKSLLLPPGFFNNKFTAPDKADEWWQRLNRRDHAMDSLEHSKDTSARSSIVSTSSQDSNHVASSNQQAASDEGIHSMIARKLSGQRHEGKEGGHEKEAFQYAVGREFFGNLAEVSSYLDPFGKELPGVTGADLLLDHVLWEWMAQRSLLIDLLQLFYQMMTVNQPTEVMSCQEFTTCIKMVFRNGKFEEHDETLKRDANKFGISLDDKKKNEMESNDAKKGKANANVLKAKEQSREHVLANGIAWKIYKEVINKSDSHDAMRQDAFVEVMLGYLDATIISVKPFETGVGQSYKSFMERGFLQELNNELDQFNADTLLWDLLWPVGLFAWNQFNYKEKLKVLWRKAQEDCEEEKANGNRKAKPNMSAAVYLKGLEKQARNSIKKQDIKLVSKALSEMNGIVYKTVKTEDMERYAKEDKESPKSSLSSLLKPSTEEGEEEEG